MKKIICILWISFILFNSYAYALDTSLLGIRKDFFNKSQEIKATLSGTKDVILMNNFFDSCIITMSQIDAYFAMLGIFNTIKERQLTEKAVNYLIDWLSKIKNTSELNIKSLNSITKVFTQDAADQIKELKTYFALLNNSIDKELEKVNALKKVVGKRKGR